MAEATEHGVPDGSVTLSQRITAGADKIKYVIIAVIVLTAAGLAIYSYTSRSAATKAAEAENRVFQSVIDLQTNPETDAIAAFSAAAKEYVGLPAGERSLVYKYSFAFNTREFAAAEEAARDLLRDYPESVMVGRAKLSLAQAQAMQGKDAEALALLRELAAANDPETLAESKFALAQALEREAEKVKSDPEAYRTALEAAEAEYNDIITRSQIEVPSQRGFWPQSITMPSDFALVILRDKLAGYVHPEPQGLAPPATPAPATATTAPAAPAETAADETPPAAAEPQAPAAEAAAVETEPEVPVPSEEADAEATTQTPAPAATGE